jgi:hypothetical protein
MKQINLRLDEDQLDQINAVRGDVPRDQWIRRAIDVRLMASNLTATEVARLVSDWRRAASETREPDAIDNAIALKLIQNPPPENGD